MRFSHPRFRDGKAAITINANRRTGACNVGHTPRRVSARNTRCGQENDQDATWLPQDFLAQPTHAKHQGQDIQDTILAILG